MKHGGNCHECAGTIVESKSNKFKVGQRVIVLPSAESHGGLVEYYPGDEGKMALIPDHGDLSEWIMSAFRNSFICMPTNGNHIR